VVTAEALEPFRCAADPRPAGDPEPLPYLRGGAADAYDIQLEVWLQTEKSARPQRICVSNAKHLYWNTAQQLAHHTVSGCNTRIGDLMGSGTISGATPDSFGSLLELTANGTRPLKLPDGGERRFLEDDDEVVLTGWAQGKDYRVGFGEVRGRIVAARSF